MAGIRVVTLVAVVAIVVAARAPPKVNDTLKNGTMTFEERRERAQTRRAADLRTRRVDSRDTGQKLRDELNSLFGIVDEEAENLGQRFVVEFPGRVLAQKSFAFAVNDSYDFLNKPARVMEQEAILADDLYKTSPDGHSILGPNGQKLSSTWELLVSNFLPKLTGRQSELFVLQNQIVDWLQEKIEFQAPSNAVLLACQKFEETCTITTDGDLQIVLMSRMAIYNFLQNIYLRNQREWKQEQSDEKALAFAHVDNETEFGRIQKLQAYEDWLMNTQPQRTEYLQSQMDDLVIRGEYHRVRMVMDYLQVKSIAEVQKELKDTIERSKLYDLTGASKYLPVTMQPENWAMTLSTDFVAEDLTMDMAQLELRYRELAKQRNAMYNRIIYMASALPRTGNVDDLRAAVETARDGYDTASRALSDQFDSNTFKAIEMLVKLYAAGNGVPDESDAAGSDLQNVFTNEGLSSITRIAADGTETTSPLAGFDFNSLFGEIKDSISGVTDAMINLNRKTQRLLQAEMDLASAIVSDRQVEIATAKQDLSFLEAEMNNLRDLIASKGGAAGLTKEDAKSASLLPGKGAPQGWFDIIVSSEQESQVSSSGYSVSSKQSGWGFSTFFGGVRTSSSSTSASSWSSLSVSDTSFEFGVRCTKVTIVRRWLDTLMFQHLAQFMPLDVNAGRLLPEFPIAFVLCKDVTLRLTNLNIEDASYKSYASQTSTTSGGFLFFSAGSASSSSSFSQGSYHYSDKNTLIIRIPGPQIMGWILQTVPNYAMYFDPNEPLNLLQDMFTATSTSSSSTSADSGACPIGADGRRARRVDGVCAVPPLPDYDLRVIGAGSAAVNGMYIRDVVGVYRKQTSQGTVYEIAFSSARSAWILYDSVTFEEYYSYGATTAYPPRGIDCGNSPDCWVLRPKGVAPAPTISYGPPGAVLKVKGAGSNAFTGFYKSVTMQDFRTNQNSGYSHPQAYQKITNTGAQFLNPKPNGIGYQYNIFMAKSTIDFWGLDAAHADGQFVHYWYMNEAPSTSTGSNLSGGQTEYYAVLETLAQYNANNPHPPAAGWVGQTHSTSLEGQDPVPTIVWLPYPGV